MPPWKQLLSSLLLVPSSMSKQRSSNISSVDEYKSSRTSQLMSLQNLGRPQWTPRNYTAFANEGYARNAICYRCVRMIAEATASIPMRIMEEGEYYKDHPILELLNNPNPNQCGPELLEEWYGYLLVSGNSYMELVSLNQLPKELYILRPDRMKIIAGNSGWPEAYQYTVDGQSITFELPAKEQQSSILHQTFFHPTNDYYGLSPFEAAASAIDIHNAASAWNKALLDNSARPSGALIYTNKDSQLTAEQYERLRQELEENFEGSKNAGKPLLLEGGLDWKNMGLTPKDMDFIEAKYVAAREIALALGVPPMLLGIPGDNTYSNYAEANRTFWRQTILPLAEKGAKALTKWLRPTYGATISLKPDISEVSALSDERELLWQRLQATEFLTINEKRAIIGYPPLEESPSG